MAEVTTNITSLSEAVKAFSPAPKAAYRSPIVLKGPNSRRGTPARSALGLSNAENTVHQVDDLSCPQLPGTPKIYDTIQPAAEIEEKQQAAQQERILKFGMMLEQFKTAKSPGAAVPEDIEREGTHTPAGATSIVQRIRPQLDGTPKASPTRSTLAEHPNELKRTPLGLSRHRAWRLSGLEHSPAKSATLGAEPIYETADAADAAAPAAAASGRPRRDVTQRLAQLSKSTAVKQMVGLSQPMAKKVVVDNAKKANGVSFESPRCTTTSPTEEQIDRAQTPEMRDYYLAAAGAPIPTPHTAKYGFTATPGNHKVNQKPSLSDEYVDVATPAPASTATAGEYMVVDTPSTESGGTAAYLMLGEDAVGHESPYTIIEPASPEPNPQLEEQMMDEAAAEPENPEVFQFAACGELQFLAETIQNGASLDARDASGRSTLMYCLQYGQVECATWLLGKGADPNAQDNTGSTALHYAAQGTNFHTVKMLLKNGADWKVRDQEGRTALHWAMKSPSSKIVAQLIAKDNESGVNAGDLNKMTALMWAAFYGQPGHMEKLRASGALAETEDETGRTALHWSLFSGNIDCVKNIINYERTFAQDEAGKSALHFASENGFVKAIKLVLSVRPQAVHDIDVNGRTPLHWASACKHAPSIELLLKHGAHPTRIDASGRTALDYARAVSCPAAIDALSGADQENAAQPRLGPAGASTSIKSFEGNGAMKNMDDEARYLLQQLAAGSQLSKYSHHGKGPLQKRFFWLDCFTGELCWTKAVSKVVKDPNGASSAYLVEIRREPSPIIMARADYDAGGKHRYAFELVCEDRTLDLVAPSEKIMNLWVDGLQMLKDYATYVLEERTDKGISSSSLQTFE